METYDIEVVREPEVNPITGQLIDCQRETFEIEADSKHDAYIASFKVSTIRFEGQSRITMINGEEYRNPTF